jgi:hypothetical protein
VTVGLSHTAVAYGRRIWPSQLGAVEVRRCRCRLLSINLNILLSYHKSPDPTKVVIQKMRYYWNLAQIASRSLLVAFDLWYQLYNRIETILSNQLLCVLKTSSSGPQFSNMPFLHISLIPLLNIPLPAPYSAFDKRCVLVLVSTYIAECPSGRFVTKRHGSLLVQLHLQHYKSIVHLAKNPRFPTNGLQFLCITGWP